MKNILRIFIRDIKNISSNKAALLIIIGLGILPSLYAWINLQACWNPYANTSNLPIAVANNDEGATFNGKNINVGHQIIEELKKNKAINWTIIDSWQGNYGLNQGNYYALIEIPSNFSKNLLSLTTTTPQKAEIIYRVNEKLNAIASKIANAATQELADNIKSNFIATVTKEVLTTLNPIGGNLETNKAKILQLKDTVTQASGNIDGIKGFIVKANSNSAALQNYLQGVQTTLPKLTEQINSLQNALEANKDLVSVTKQALNQTSGDINNDQIQLQALNQQIQLLLATLKQTNTAADNHDLVNIVNELSAPLHSVSNLIDADIKSLESINQSYPNSQLVQLIRLLKKLEGLINDEETKIASLKTLLDNSAATESVNSLIDQISSQGDEIANIIGDISHTFYGEGLKTLNNLAADLTNGLDNSNDLLESTKVIVPQLNALANYGIASSKVSVQEANNLSNQLSALQTELNGLSAKLKDLNEKNLDALIKLMTTNPDKMADFLSSPVDVKEVDIYDMKTFGVGLTPFYTVLAIWVGGLLCSSLLSVTPVLSKNNSNFSPTLLQEHFGKMLLFLAISLIQALIVTLGDKFILGVSPANLPLMLGFALLSGFTFTTIIFTLVSIFGNVGKAIAVVIMVFQIAGSGGIYPIQTNPRIFGILQPLWPFTYAIGGFREAIAGPLWPEVSRDALALLIFSGFFCSLVVLKKPFHRLTTFMEHKFRASGL